MFWNDFLRCRGNTWTMCEFQESNCNGFGDIWWTDKCIYFSSIDGAEMETEARHTANAFGSFKCLVLLRSLFPYNRFTKIVLTQFTEPHNLDGRQLISGEKMWVRNTLDGGKPLQYPTFGRWHFYVKAVAIFGLLLFPPIFCLNMLESTILYIDVYV